MNHYMQFHRGYVCDERRCSGRRHRAAACSRSPRSPTSICLPIYDKPMIYYPIQTLVDAGIREILVVTGGRNSGDFLRLLANGKEFGLKHLDYTYQEGEGGIADALGAWPNISPTAAAICVILGDNIIEGSIRRRGGGFPAAGIRREDPAQRSAGRRALRRGGDSRRPHCRESKRSPSSPSRTIAVTGIYMYDETVFDKVRTAGAFRPRRTGDHRRQQRLHSRRHHDLRAPGRLVDRRRHLRFACCAPGIWWRKPAAHGSTECELPGVATS